MKLNTILLAGAAMFAATGASAQSANFSLSETFDTGYVFATGSNMAATITGTFTGTKNDNIISNLSNINLFLNGVAFNGNGNLFTAEYIRGLGYVNSGGGQLSLDGTANNVFISNADIANYQYNYTNFFSIVPNATDYALNGLAAGYNDYTDNASNHLVITELASTGAVPEPAAWAMMILGVGAIGFAMRRQKITTRVSYAA